MRKCRLIAMIFMGLMFQACVDEITIGVPRQEEVIVVDAWFGNTEEDSFVRIYTASPFLSGILKPRFDPVPVGSVYVEDTKGNRVDFVRNGPTLLFKPESHIVPVAGESYRLVLDLSEKGIFSSEWEKVPPIVEVEELRTSAYEALVLINSGTATMTQTKTFAGINAVIKDPGAGKFGYFLRTSGISERYTRSDSDNCQCVCYSEVPNLFNRMNLISNEAFEGREFVPNIGEIPLSSIGRFHVETTLKTISGNNLEYLQRIDDQQKNTGSIFDPSPSRIRGNISSREEGGEIILGNFFVYQESKFDAMLSRSQIRMDNANLNHFLDPILEVEATCTEVFIDDVTVPPPPFVL